MKVCLRFTRVCLQLRPEEVGLTCAAIVEVGGALIALPGLEWHLQARSSFLYLEDTHE
jgi:hypothetical protein